MNNENLAQFHHKLLSLKPQIIKEVTNAINKAVKKSGNLQNYKIVWNQLESLASPEIEKILKSNFSNCKIIFAKSKSAYPDIRVEFKELRIAIDIKSNESSKNPWFDIARLDTIIEKRINKYDEEYELIVKYDSESGQFIKMFFETLKDAVGINTKCDGVKFRPYDGKLRPKSWADFDSGKSYWQTKERFLDGIKKSKKYRWKELMRNLAKTLSREEKEEFKALFD